MPRASSHQNYLQGGENKGEKEVPRINVRARIYYMWGGKEKEERKGKERKGGFGRKRDEKTNAL
jgi:hypothetical protein